MYSGRVQGMGLRDLAAGAGSVQPQGAPPSAGNPGGITAAFDQAMQGYEAASATLEQLSRDLKFLDDAESAQIAMMAAKLTQMKAKRAGALQSAMSTMQGVAGGGGPPMPGIGG